MVGIGGRLKAMLFEDLLDEEICDLAIKVIASEMCIAIGRKDFEDAVLEFQDGNIEGSDRKSVV